MAVYHRKYNSASDVTWGVAVCLQVTTVSRVNEVTSSGLLTASSGLVAIGPVTFGVSGGGSASNNTLTVNSGQTIVGASSNDTLQVSLCWHLFLCAMQHCCGARLNAFLLHQVNTLHCHQQSCESFIHLQFRCRHAVLLQS